MTLKNAFNMCVTRMPKDRDAIQKPTPSRSGPWVYVESMFLMDAYQ